MAEDGRDALARILVSNDGEVISRLRLSAAEAARVCNVTPRQLIYWTKKGLVRPSDDGEHDYYEAEGEEEGRSGSAQRNMTTYDVFAMEKVIRIRQALEKGYSLEKAAQLVQRDLAALQGEVERLGSMEAEELETELRRRLERLEERLAQLRRTLPTTLTISRLRRAVAALAKLETAGELHGSASNGDSARSLALRLTRAVDELESALREVQPSSA